MNNLHLKFKEVRDNLKLSQIEFAKTLNISRSGIAQIESGKTNPSFDLIYKIVKVHGINPNLFFNDLDINQNNDFVYNDVQVKIPTNAQVSKNDLKILTEIFHFPTIDEIIPFLSKSEARNKAILKDAKQELKEKLTTYNSIIEIAIMLKINDVLDKYDTIINIEKYIKGVIEDYEPDEYREGLAFESMPLKIIIQIIAFKESIDHITFLIDKIVKYLKKDCSFMIKIGNIKVSG